MKFPSKILLFGEYGLVVGGSGFAIPFPEYFGELKLHFNKSTGSVDQSHSDPSSSHQSIHSLFNFITKNSIDFSFIDLDHFSSQLEQGLWFDSNIPNGYGLGSSGALVAAIYSAYKTDMVDDLWIVRKRLASMEQYFHGSSSGVDPTVSYFQRPVLLQNLKNIELLPNWTLQKLGLFLYLIDTGTTSKTLSLVDWFKTQMQKPTFKHYANSDFLAVNQRIIETISTGKKVVMSDVLAISHYQLDYLTPMIPDAFRKHFFAGLESREFTFKLCGSGGGGFMLGITEKKDSFEAYCKSEDLPLIKI